MSSTSEFLPSGVVGTLGGNSDSHFLQMTNNFLFQGHGNTICKINVPLSLTQCMALLPSKIFL